MKAKRRKSFALAIAGVGLFIVLSVFYAQYITNLLTLESQMHLSEVATQGAASVQRQVARDFDILEVLADGSVSDPNVPFSAKMARIKKQANKFGLYRIALVDLQGNATTSDGYEFSVADRAFFQSAVKGERFLSQPIIDKVDGVTPGVVYAVPVYHGGKVVSVLFSGYELDKLTERIDISFYHKSGLAFIANSKGDILLHPIKERIGTNITSIATPLNKAETVEQFKRNLIEGKGGVTHFIMKTQDRFFAYAPIQGANDWFLFSSLPAAAVFERSQIVIWLTICLLVGILIILVLAWLYIAFTKKKANEKIVNLAYYDPLTKSANTERFKLNAEALFKQHGSQEYTLLNFDVKQFRYLNNDLGYEAGNSFLIHIAQCLGEACVAGETFARAGTDQFLFLVHSRKTEKEMLEYINNLRKQIGAWRQHSGGYYAVLLIFGAYKIDYPNADIVSAIEKSNIARRAAKIGQEPYIEFYNGGMQDKIDHDTALEKLMPKALSGGEFKLYIQPKYNIESGKIIGGEALVRWIKPDGTLIMPNEFIPLFEQTGSIYRLDMYMLDLLCKFLRSQLNRGISAVPISINQSRRYMYSPTYIEEISTKLRKLGIPTNMVELEITEALVYSDIEKLIEILESLHKAGFLVSLDDFGSGYSSLNVLKNLPVDTLKLDRFMLGETLNSQREKIVVANVIRMAKELNMSVVAEGVETHEQVHFLKVCGCEMAQGYYYSKPISSEEFERLLGKQ